MDLCLGEVSCRAPLLTSEMIVNRRLSLVMSLNGVKTRESSSNGRVIPTSNAHDVLIRCYLLRKPDPPVQVAVTDPSKKGKPASVQVLDYNLRR